ncbi:MAG: hypothetical protein JO244_04190 [Solirubrobacterales bacterium]|nr:hypothetical protein [Solirubrobacterales bacterium]
MAVVCLLAALALTGCGDGAGTSALSGVPRSLILEARPIGRGPAFHPPATGPVIGRCSRSLGTRIGVHLELFAANQVVLVAQGIGTRPPRSFSAGRISAARCYGDLVTIDPTGLVLVRPGRSLTVSDLFRSWGEPLSDQRLASFSAGARRRVSVFVDGRRVPGPAGPIALSRHSEIVLEVGPYVPPHASYTFPPGT